MALLYSIHNLINVTNDNFCVNLNIQAAPAPKKTRQHDDQFFFYLFFSRNRRVNQGTDHVPVALGLFTTK